MKFVDFQVMLEVAMVATIYPSTNTHMKVAFLMRLATITKQRTKSVPLSTNVVHVSLLARVMSYRITLDGKSANTVSSLNLTPGDNTLVQ